MRILIYAYLIKAILRLNDRLSVLPFSAREVGKIDGDAASLYRLLGESANGEPGYCLICIDGGIGSALDRLDEGAAD